MVIDVSAEVQCALPYAMAGGEEEVHLACVPVANHPVKLLPHRCNPSDPSPLV